MKKTAEKFLYGEAREAMDMQKLQTLIGKMVYPGATVNSLTMFANKMDTSYGLDGLREFLAALCRLDIHKAAAVALRLSGSRRTVAVDYISQVLTERCNSGVDFSYLDLLAIADFGDADLLVAVSPFLTADTLEKAMQCGDCVSACTLMRLCITALPQESADLARDAFCKLLADEYNDRMEIALRELLPCLLERDEADVLSALVEVAGAQRVTGLYGEELSGEIERLILSGKDSVGVWELYFQHLFEQSPTQEELQINGLWFIQLYAGDDIYETVCASFYLHTAVRYGVDLPIFDYIEGERYSAIVSRRYIMRYRDAIRPLWKDPAALSLFLKRTSACNPFLRLMAQTKRYQLLQTAADRTAYNRLQSLFEAGLSAADIIAIFFATDLKQRLPLEDVFYLAQRYETLPELLEELRNHPFIGRVAVRDSRRFFLSPYAYFSSALHAVPINYKVLERIGRLDQLRGRKLQYLITGFFAGYIQVEVCGGEQLTETDDEDVVTWETAIEQLRQATDLQNLTKRQLMKFAVTEFTLDDVMGESDLNLLTQLIMERADCLGGFLTLLSVCKWNASFMKPELPLPKSFFSMCHQYRQDATELFRSLLETQEDLEPVLQLYFTSVYRAVVPLNQLLIFAPRERILNLLPNFVIYCHLLEEGSVLCRMSNVSCMTVCALENGKGVSYNDHFSAVITDYTIEGDYISKILLKPYQSGSASMKAHRALFGYLASNIAIDSRREQRMAALPSAADCRYNELKFNIRCMEDAVLLRRANPAELKHLIQALGDANPFAFDLNYYANLIYLRKEKRDEDAQGAALSMILNAKSMEDIRDFYLHTHIKFHLQLPRLVSLIRERRADLEDQIPGMFESVTFHAIADSQGRIWMPWVPQDTLRVSGEYTGMVLNCAVVPEIDESVVIHVEEAEESDVFYQILESCLLGGYRTDPEMDALVESRKAEMSAEENPPGEIPAEESPDDEILLSDDVTLSYGEYYARLRQFPRSERFSHEVYSQAIMKMIVTYTAVPATKMQQALANLTRKWLHLQPDRERIPAMMQEVCQCYVRQYQNTNLCQVFGKLLYDYFGMEQARSFEQQMKVSLSAPQETKAVDRVAVTFQRTCEKLLAQMGSTFYISRRLVKLIEVYHDQVSREEMETAISILTAEWIRMYNPDYAALNELLNIHTGLIEAYQSGSFGVILCRQGYQYLPDAAADRLERGVCKITGQLLGEHPDLIQMLPPLDERIDRLLTCFRDPEFPPNEAVKRIGKMIRHYYRAISAEEMMQTVLTLTDILLTIHWGYEHLSHMVRDLSRTFESCYGIQGLERCLWSQMCSHLDKEIASAHQKSESLSATVFSAEISKIIVNYKDCASAEDMRQAVVELTGHWLEGVSDAEATIQALMDIYKSFYRTYSSADLGSDLCLKVQSSLGQTAMDSLQRRIRVPNLHVKGNPPPRKSLEERKADLALRLSEPDFRDRPYGNKVRDMIRRNWETNSPEEIAQAVAELAEQWMQLRPDEEQLSYNLYGIHDCFIKYCGTDHLAGMLCQLFEKYLGEEAGKRFAEKLERPLKRLLDENPPESENIERI